MVCSPPPAPSTWAGDSPQAEHARLVEFPQATWLEHLETLEGWIRQDLVVYAEPDLLAEITDDAFPADPPKEGWFTRWFTRQPNLKLQKVYEAWRFLHGKKQDLTLGSPEVRVATLDRGIRMSHPDIGGRLTDGRAQLADECWDFSGLRRITQSYRPSSSHGMGVFGIIAARTNNRKGISGIAPNTCQLAMERPNVYSARYADVLLWAAGFTTGNPSKGWPREPLSPAADVISCSHGANGLALSGPMDDALKKLATHGPRRQGHPGDLLRRQRQPCHHRLPHLGGPSPDPGDRQPPIGPSARWSAGTGPRTSAPRSTSVPKAATCARSTPNAAPRASAAPPPRPRRWRRRRH